MYECSKDPWIKEMGILFFKRDGDHISLRETTKKVQAALRGNESLGGGKGKKMLSEHLPKH